MKNFSSIRSSLAAMVAAISAVTFGDRQRKAVIFGTPRLVDKEPIYIDAPLLPQRGQRLHLVQKRRDHARNLLRDARLGEAPVMNRAARRLDAKRLRYA